MMRRNPTTKRSSSTAQVLSALLLLLYVAGTSQVDILHTFIHRHDAAVNHSAEQEENPCHRLIYHDDASKGCEHHSHLLVSHKCQMCDVVSHSDQGLLAELSGESPVFSTPSFNTHKVTLDSHCAVISSSRAPPLVR